MEEEPLKIEDMESTISKWKENEIVRNKVNESEITNGNTSKPPEEMFQER